MPTKTKIFLSWGLPRSRHIAEALYNWLPQVITSIEPFFSQDIEKGTKGLDEIDEKLEEYRFGIVCLTPENRTNEWIHYESGALSKLKKGSRLWTVLYGLEPAEVGLPLSLFQHTKLADKADVLRLVKSINNNSEQIPETRLKAIFEKWWPDLEEQLTSVPELPNEAKSKSQNGSSGGRSEGEKLDEALELIRALHERSTSVTRVTTPQMVAGVLKPPSLTDRIDVYITGENREARAMTILEILKPRLLDYGYSVEIISEDSRDRHVISIKFDPPLRPAAVTRLRLDGLVDSHMISGRDPENYE
jgi:hypothetical protein